MIDISIERTAHLIERSSTIILTPHVHPDGDCLGSMLALWEHLTNSGKNVQMLLDDDLPSLYDFLPGLNAIRRPVENVQADLLIVLDASDKERIGRVKSVVDAPILNIDHHISNTGFADYRYLDVQASATGQIVLQLLRTMDANITADMAVCLYTAIATDCGFFRYANTTPDTMRDAADLIAIGAKPNVISEALETKPLASIRTLAKVLTTLELFHEGKIAILSIDSTIMDSSENTEGFVDYPRCIQGVEVAVLFKFIDQETARVSLRSKGVDVSRVALAFGGGGHIRAAGCTVRGSSADIKKKVVAAAFSQLKESNL